MMSDKVLANIYPEKRTVTPTTEVEILDLEELKEVQDQKRKEYESYLKRNRLDIGQWLRYAKFELDNQNIRRARSIYERALLVHGSNISLWIRYIDSEIKTKNINHARNILERSITVLPRVDKLWYKYLTLEETLQNYDIVRNLFKKWVSLEPLPSAWNSYVEFEIRQKSWENVRDIYVKYTQVFPQANTWFRWINFESTYGSIELVRQVFSLSIDTLTNYDSVDGNIIQDTIRLIIAFANWEFGNDEYERARTLYTLALEKWPDNQVLRNSFVSFEKQIGSIPIIEDSILFKRKRKYEEQLTLLPYSYDTWWVYLDLLEQNYPQQYVSAFEDMLIKSKPTDNWKSPNWKRYICFWIRYFIFLEFGRYEIDLIEEKFNHLLLNIIPYENFSFSELWIMYSEFLARNKTIDAMRKVFGKAIGINPDGQIFKRYIEIELLLKEFDRVRRIYEKYIKFNSGDLSIWLEYADLEENLGDEERCRQIYNLIINNEIKGITDVMKYEVFQKFISFETQASEFSNARELYENFLVFSSYNTDIWNAYALFISTTPTEEQLEDLQNLLQNGEDVEFEPNEVNKEAARAIFQRALNYFKAEGKKYERYIIVKYLIEYEKTDGNSTTQEIAQNMLPKINKVIKNENNVEKEYVEYIFPEEIEDKPVFATPKVSKFLELAQKWKKENNP
ncbi:hypothetical protein TBLA_0A03850 [Henningerozyma blattae CBS 6284]|uniref:Pre-mRNA-splicing factor CLF1 n=1 Tax=Henningerozyma blattae (strain ATCC 34711 / CBS 6284 / DSM 70876 / NBRC 10599 / NRRL Y-10934 / UCD 77-7) TaxID=1071380 RepID=I2GVN1_HENB6|nr:hypothetical protein TBLA_0A03850 [Tetrapisispora blattae CBS 6284]CCH58183.1 hypothetical protein TBLA_0A03850 [Tetrapisispora blattae CBS 6284]